VKTEQNLVGYAITFLCLTLKFLIREGIYVVAAPQIPSANFGVGVDNGGR
jgi:hypothetical protein